METTSEKRYSRLMEDGTFNISTASFEGPLPLLLELVKKRKVFISDIALADVADEFIRIVQSRERTLAEDADFVSVAATLLLIKSKSLLPGFTLTHEEEESAEDLANRLAQFEGVRQRASELGRYYGKTIFITRRAPRDTRSFFVPDEQVTAESVLKSALGVQSRLPQKQMPERLSVKQTIRLEDVLTDLSKRIKKHLAFNFSEFANLGSASRRDVVVHFVALLELVKQGFIEAEQRERGGDIKLKHQDVSVPNYS